MGDIRISSIPDCVTINPPGASQPISVKEWLRSINERVAEEIHQEFSDDTLSEADLLYAQGTPWGQYLRALGSFSDFQYRLFQDVQYQLSREHCAGFSDCIDWGESGDCIRRRPPPKAPPPRRSTVQHRPGSFAPMTPHRTPGFDVSAMNFNKAPWWAQGKFEDSNSLPPPQAVASLNPKDYQVKTPLDKIAERSFTAPAGLHLLPGDNNHGGPAPSQEPPPSMVFGVDGLFSGISMLGALMSGSKLSMSEVGDDKTGRLSANVAYDGKYFYVSTHGCYVKSCRDHTCVADWPNYWVRLMNQTSGGNDSMRADANGNVLIRIEASPGDDVMWYAQDGFDPSIYSIDKYLYHITPEGELKLIRSRHNERCAQCGDDEE